MTVKTFFYGLAASFGLPWLVMIAVPYGSMNSLEAPQYDENKDEKTGAYHPKYSGRITTGSEIYAQEGCIMCHSQLTRPTYAGLDVFRDGQGGFKAHPDLGDTRRITHAWDFKGEERANIGETRIGPDLGNYGSRVDAIARDYNAKLAEELGVDVDKLGDKAFDKELYVYKRLYNPSLVVVNAKKTNCPKNSRFFDKKQIFGQQSSNVVATKGKYKFIPNDRGRAVASYLLNLKRDGEVPAHMQYNKENKAPAKKEK